MAYLGVPQSKLENLTTNVQIVNLSASFDGTTVTFNLQDSRGDAVSAVHERALLVILGGITQKPGVDYTTSGSTITFTTAPVSNLTIHIRKLYGVQRIIGVNDGVISPVKLSTGGPVWNSSGNLTISGDLNVTGSFNAGTNGLFWEDNERAKFGADNDLEIYHDGNSWINSTSGNLYIKSENDTDIYVRAADDLFLQAGGSSPGVKVVGGGATELHHPGIGEKKLETTSTGILLTSTDTGSTAAPEIDLFRNSISPADSDYLGQIKFTGKQDGGGTVNYAKITGKILDASNGTEDGILEFMLRKGGSNNIAARFRSDSLQLLNGTGLTVNGTTTLSGDLSLDDDVKAKFGAGDDLEIYHDGTNSTIDNNTGDLNISTTGSGDDIYLDSADDIYLRVQGNESGVSVIGNGAVELYQDNSKKFETITTGVKVTGALEVTQEYPSIRPVLDLNFAATKTLDRRITFTRDSIGTYVDDMGIVRYASNNVPRFDHDPTTGESLGLLIEESRTNEIQYSNSGSGFVDAPYYGNWNAAPYTDNFAVAPDGTTTAWKMTPNTPSSSRQRTISVTAGNTYTFSVWLKKDPSVSVSDGVWNYFKYLITWNTSPIGATTQQLVSGSTTSAELTTEWRRFSVSYTAPSGATTMQFGLSNANSGSGNPGYSVFVWGAQIELGSFASSYIPTNGTLGTRAQDFAKITGTNFTDFYNQTEGTAFVHALMPNPKGNSGIPAYAFKTSANSNYYYGFSRDSVGAYHYINTSNANTFVMESLVNEYRAVLGIKTNDLNSYINDANQNVNLSTVTLFDADILHLGSTTTTNVLNGHIKRFSYYPKRLPDAQLQGLTQQ